MQVLTVDVGTGTQDIFLYDSRKSFENGYQLVMPSPTVRLANRVKEATRLGEPLLLEGVLMGGGPVGWAVRDHAQAGNPVYCLADPARTFDDDPERVARMGVRVISEDEIKGLVGRHSDLVRLKLGDFDFEPIAAAFEAFGFDLKPDALAVAVFDHGNSPPHISDRTFRFEFIAESLARTNDLSVFAYPADQIPDRLTRFEAAGRTAASQLPGLPTLLMDTGPAAAFGALDDEQVARAVDDCAIVANLGNFHTLAFLFEQGRVRGTFEHHTGEVTPEQLTGFLEKLAHGSLTNAEIFDSQGHGAVFLANPDQPPGMLAVTGPRRAMLRDRFVQLKSTSLAPYYAVPNGDMMLAGNYGLLKAMARHFPGLSLELDQARRSLALDW